MRTAETAQVNRGPLAGILFRILGRRYWGIRLVEDGVILDGRTPEKISFIELFGPISAHKGLWFGSVSIPIGDRKSQRVTGLRKADASNFAELADAAWRHSIKALMDGNDGELRTLSDAFGRLEQPRRFPSACLIEPFLKRAGDLSEQLPKFLLEGVGSVEQRQMIKAVSKFLEAPATARNSGAAAFVAAELSEMNDFFDTIESNPLTPEQRVAVVTDEDATLVLAGAGSGKTSVIVAKAAYLIRRGIRKPEEILLLAFGKDAAEEMATRIEERCGAPVTARTFHALGYEILREVEGQAPALAPHASDDVQFRALLRDILINDVAKQEGMGDLLLKWFSEFYWPYKSEWDFKTKDAYFQYVEEHELRTLQGEIVRSFEEWEIANWLYLNGIAYEYEPVYEHELSANDRRAYTPDFRLKDSGVYIEHFGVRKRRGPDGEERLETAPYVDRDEYLRGMEWKREVHNEHATILLETYSYERVEGRLTEALAEKLAPYAEVSPLPPDQVFETLGRLGQVDAFTQLVATFLRHFKSAGATVEKCRSRISSSSDAARSQAFLTIFEPLYEAYQRRLEGRIDFEDMIVLATKHVLAGRYHSPYRHLLVDEFQDISEGRARLLLALKSQHDDARIFAVGDDWQSIYRFTGSDIHLMRNFGQELGGTFAGSSAIHSTVDLGRTFRSVDRIALPARRFVLKNPSQIEKKVVPAGETREPAIAVTFSNRQLNGADLRSILDEIDSFAEHGRKTSVLLLGRYHFVKPDDLREITKAYPDLSIRYMTVHASKGLEADHVIILRAASGRMGFPSEIVDDPLLDLVLPEPEKFYHAEERRLFYVALTRARKTVHILADKDKPSAFVRELIDDPEYGVVEFGMPEVAAHRCDKCGGRMMMQSGKGGRTRFACEHRFLCGETLRACDHCNRDIPTRVKSISSIFTCSCGERFPACPDCDSGWLVERKGRHGKFLGCVNYPACKGSKPLSNERKIQK